MDSFLIKIMQVLARSSLPYMLQGSKLHIGDHLLQIDEMSNGEYRLILDSTDMILADVLSWIDELSETSEMSV